MMRLKVKIEEIELSKKMIEADSQKLRDDLLKKDSEVILLMSKAQGSEREFEDLQRKLVKLETEQMNDQENIQKYMSEIGKQELHIQSMKLDAMRA